MQELLEEKFKNPVLQAKLLAVKGEIVEHNQWHDNFWGSCTCPKCGNKGNNALGKMLMNLRNELSEW